MTPLWITSSTNMINDRATAIEFDAVFSAYMKEVNHLSTCKSPTGFLQQVYAMFVFDPNNRAGNNLKYFKRRNEVETYIEIGREEFKCLATADRREMLHSKLLKTLMAVRDDLDKRQVRHELDGLITAVNTLERSGAHRLAQQLSTADNTVSSVATLSGFREYRGDASEEKFQLILQLPETSFHNEQDMFDFEECLTEMLGDKAEVDGNDVGLGKLNLFILTDKPREIFEFLRPFLERAKLLNVARAAYTELGDDHYHTLWPEGDVQFEL